MDRRCESKNDKVEVNKAEALRFVVMRSTARVGKLPVHGFVYGVEPRLSSWKKKVTWHFQGISIWIWTWQSNYIKRCEGQKTRIAGLQLYETSRDTEKKSRQL